MLGNFRAEQMKPDFTNYFGKLEETKKLCKYGKMGKIVTVDRVERM